MNLSSEIAQHLLQIKAIKLSPQKPFTWASGIQSPIYCDNRMVLSYPNVRKVVQHGLAEKSQGFGDFDVVAGVATAGIAHGLLLADITEKPFIYVRSSAKGHGRQNLIEGEIPKGKKVLVVEDLISTGGSAIKAINALKEAGADVVGCLAIFTYGFDKAVKAFQEAGVPMDTLSDYDILIDQAVKENYISDTDLNQLKSWRATVGE